MENYCSIFQKATNQKKIKFIFSGRVGLEKRILHAIAKGNIVAADI